MLCAKAHKETDVKYMKLFNWFLFSFVFVCKSLMHHHNINKCCVYGEWGIIISKMFLMIIKRYLVWYCDHWSMKIYFQFKSYFFYSLTYLLSIELKIFFWFNCDAASIMIFCYDIIDASFEFVWFGYFV